MSAVRTMTPGWANAPLRLPTARELFESAATARLFLDRQIDFWLGEIDPAWSLSERRARVVDVIDETHDVKTFLLEPGSSWPQHIAGQYVPVDVEIDGVRVRRCYSISSAPGPGRLAITVKRVEGGRVSTFLHARVKPGSVIGLGEPAGDFVLPSPLPPKLLLLSGGSGVTPVMSILRQLCASGAVGDVVFLHAARSEADVVFRSELLALAERQPGLRLILRCDDDPEGDGPLNEARIRALVPDFAQRERFCAARQA